MLKRDAVRIFHAALKAAGPEQAILRHLSVRNGALIAAGRKYPMDRYRRIHVVGAGKASAVMARAVERLLGRRIAGGMINVKDGHTAKLRFIGLNECGHPVPDERGVQGAEIIEWIANGATEDDLVIALISGGGSALLPYPAPPVTLAQKQETTKLLLQCGASIDEINAVRKHISAIKGGQLARMAYPAQVLALLLSDVIGDRLDVIGSGPTVPDPTTFADARALLAKYELVERVPKIVLEHIDAGIAGDVEETPKPGAPEFAAVHNIVVGSNALAVDAAVAEAKALGYRPLVLSTSIAGETRDIAAMHAAIAREAASTGRPVKAPACIISGGETTVTIRGNGLGGRNMEFALAAAIELKGVPNVVVLSGGTDGTDGPTDAAGAIADGATAAKNPDAAAYLANNDSYHFFQAARGLLKTGPTGTNVMDIRIMLVGK